METKNLYCWEATSNIPFWSPSSSISSNSSVASSSMSGKVHSNSNNSCQCKDISPRCFPSSLSPLHLFYHSSPLGSHKTTGPRQDFFQCLWNSSKSSSQEYKYLLTIPSRGKLPLQINLGEYIHIHTLK